MKRIASFAAAAALALAGAPAAHALGPLDPGFGEGGRVSILGGEGPMISDMARDSAGRTVVSGAVNAAADQWTFFRIDGAGRLDRSFGYPPLTSRELSSDMTPGDLARRPSGGWVSAGTFGRERPRIAVRAHRADGLVDTAFGGGDGVAELDLPGASSATSTVATLPDGRILLAGHANRSTGDVVVVARFTSAGDLDRSWSDDGVKELPGGVRGCNAGRGALLPRPDGGVLVAGQAGGEQQAPAPVLHRLDRNGRLVPGGTVPLTPRRARGTVAGAVPRQGDSRGAIVALSLGDACRFRASRRFAATAVGADGQVDPTFGRGGTATVSFPLPATARDVVRLHGGRIAIVGGLLDSADTGWAVARLTARGRLDRDFGGGRTCTELVGAVNGPATAAVRMPGDRLLVGMTPASDEADFRFFMYRRAFTPGGVECFQVQPPQQSQPARSLRLGAILGRRGRLRLRVRHMTRDTRRSTTACLGTRGPGDVRLRWNGLLPGAPVRAGLHRVVLESVDRRGRLLGRSYSRVVSLAGRPSGPRGPRC